MPVPANNDEFLDLIRKSGVVEETRIKAFLDRVEQANATIPEQPIKFASWLVRDGVLTYFQAEQILQGKYKRFSIGKYKVLEKLGIGGMGQVFLCEHKMMRRRVAVKVLPIANSDNEAARDRFYREARAVAALDHPNIVRAYDVDQDDNLHFLVMEFVDGTNLHDLVKKHGPLDITRACHFIYASAAGLEYANGMGIVHRDIKPGNILVDRNGIVKILDMGLALFFRGEDDDGLTRHHDENVLGTADYLSPEQAIDSHTVDIRADIYSLGGTFYYLLTGSAPFPEGSVAQKLLKHQTAEPKPLQERRPEVPDEVVAIVAKMMAKDTADRYATPGELMADLTPYVQIPIAPPTEAEMPKFSRAAVGNSNASRGAPSSVSLSGSSSGIPSLAFQSSMGGAQNSMVIADPKAAPAIWEDIAAATTPNSSADTPSTKPRTAPPPPSKRSSPVADPRPKKKKLLLGGIAAGVLLAVLGAYLVFGGKSKPGTPGTQAPVVTGPRTLYVTKRTGQSPDVTFPTLASAVAKAGPGDTIKLLDDPHVEPPVRIIANSAGKLTGVVIEAGNPASRVTLKPPPGPISGKRGFLELTATDGLTIRNLDIDARSQLDFCITIQGKIDGLVLENLTLKGAATADLFVEKAHASPDRRARFDRLAIRVDAPNCDGIQFVGDANTPVNSVIVENCRFIGRGWNAVHFRGPARDVDFRNNRVYQFEQGVLFEGPDGASAVNVTRNTFHSLNVGILLKDKPPENPPNSVNLSLNYFAKCKDVLRGPDRQFPGLQANDNARDQESRPGEGMNPQAAEVKGYTLPPPDNDSDSMFLLIGDASPLKAFGPKKIAIGAQ